MKKLALLLLLVPALASADKSYNAETNVTHDCATDDDVSINVSEAVFTFVGTCKRISVNGAENKLTVETVKRITINGAENKADVAATDEITVNGADNTVTYKKGIKKAKPAVKVRGLNSKVTKAK